MKQRRMNIWFGLLTFVFVASLYAQQTVMNGQLVVPNINGLIFVDGKVFTTFASAFAVCPSTGCTIDMTGNPNSAALTLGAIDPGTTRLTLKLGPYNYTSPQITLESGFRIYGSSSGGTTITATSLTNPLFVLSQTNVPASGVVLSDFQLVQASATNGNTADGIDLDCSTVTGGGLWFSEFKNLILQNFNGVSFRIRGPSGGFSSNTQFSKFDNIDVFRNSASAGECLRVEGANSNFQFNRFECTSNNQSGQNFYLGYLTGGTGGYPLSITFNGVVNQESNIGFVLNGVFALKLLGVHFENVKTTGFSFGGNANNGVTIDSAYASGNNFINGGTGSVMNFSGITTNDQSVTFSNNVLCGFGTCPDNLALYGATAASPVAHSGNTGAFVSPTVSATGFGASSGTTLTSSQGSENLLFYITVGTSPSSGSATITMPPPANYTGWSCTFNDQTTPATNLPRQNGVGTKTSVTVTNYNASGSATAPTAGDVIQGLCRDY